MNKLHILCNNESVIKEEHKMSKETGYAFLGFSFPLVNFKSALVHVKDCES